MNERALLDAVRGASLTVSRALYVRLDQRWKFDTRGAYYTRMYFVTAGSGFLKTDEQYVEMTPGNVYFIPPGCAFSCGCEYLEKIFFHVNISTLEKYDLFSSIKRIFSLPFCVDEIKKIKSLLSSDRYVDVIRIQSFLYKTVIDFAENCGCEAMKIKDCSPQLQKIITYIEENAAINLKVSDISRAFFISDSKTRNIFKKEMNMPIGKYIDDMVFIKARQMLSNAKNSIAAVSAELGFCDQFYFSRRFKEKFGITPTKFRKINKVY